MTKGIAKSVNSDVFLGLLVSCLPLGLGFQKRCLPCISLSLAGCLCVRDVVCSISHTSASSQIQQCSHGDRWPSRVWIESSSYPQSLLYPCGCEPGGLDQAQLLHDWCHHQFSSLPPTGPLSSLPPEGAVISFSLTACNTAIAPLLGSLIPFLSPYNLFSTRHPEWSFENTNPIMWNGVATMENGMAVPQKIKHRITMWNWRIVVFL